MTIYWLLSGRVGFEHSFAWGQGMGGGGKREKKCPLSPFLCTLSNFSNGFSGPSLPFKTTTVAEFLRLHSWASALLLCASLAPGP